MSNPRSFTISSMFGVTRHLRVGLVFLSLLLLSFMPLQAGAADGLADPHAVAETPKVIITELQTNGGLAAQEFIELYNTTGEVIYLDPATAPAGSGAAQWKLQFYGSGVLKDGTPVWPQSMTPYVFFLKGAIQPYDYFLVASTDHKQLDITLPPEQIYSKSNPMTDSGGGLQLIEVPNTTVAGPAVVHDQLLWLDPKDARGEGVLPSPAKFGSLQREPNDSGAYINEDGSLQDFVSNPGTTPLAEWKAPIVEELIGADDGTAAGPVDEADSSGTLPIEADNTGLLPPYLTELLPNPASPLKDEADEFIELFNPNAGAFNLKGYTLEVGTTTLHDFTLTEDLVIPPESYIVLYSKDTRLSLTNSGGQARMLDPQGVKLSETLPYGAADEGAAWTFTDNTWQWSTAATPGLPNIITAPVTAAKTSGPATKTTTKKVAAAKVKGTTKTKTKAAAQKKTKKAAKPKVAAVARLSDKPPRAPIHNGVLVSVAAAAVLYAAYEYRHDLSNRIHRVRSHRRIRAVAR